MNGWTDIEAEKIGETEKAIRLQFDFRGGWRLWIPKSCYREYRRGPFNVQEIKTWFVTKNNLWDIINDKVRPI